MKSIFAFLFILLMISLLGVVWGIYDYQIEKKLTTSEVISMLDKFIYSYFKYRKNVSQIDVIPDKIPSKIQEKIITPTIISDIKQEKEITPTIISDNVPVKTEEEGITPSVTAPITPTEIEFPVPPPYVKRLVKKAAQGLVEEGNRFYDEGVKHLQNTFKKDSTFDKENNIAIEKFREAMKIYLKAEEIDSESQWLMNRIRDTNQNLVTCRKQSRRQ
ncbi:MAG: hypothetical protein V1871_04875 [Planctomycetota bacterium]